MDERLKEVETELRKIQKEWINMYETVIRLINEGKATDYIEDQEQKDD